MKSEVICHINRKKSFCATRSLKPHEHTSKRKYALVEFVLPQSWNQTQVRPVLLFFALYGPAGFLRGVIFLQFVRILTRNIFFCFFFDLKCL